MPFLIDDQSSIDCEGKTEKQVFNIQLDSVRKALDIDTMEDVELLVQTFYEQSRKERLGGGMSEMGSEMGDDHKEYEQESPTKRLDDEMDDDETELDIDEVVECVRQFQMKREEKINNTDNIGGNPRMKKKSNFETEDQKKERIKKEERMFWEKMTTVLSEQKKSVWSALDQALAKYYRLLVERRNMIEDTGLLNQQNEELKTLLNQYLQAGVNHELNVPPTQVIRLDI